MQNVAETYAGQAAAASAAGNANTPETADAAAFTRELSARLADYNTDKIAEGMDKLAAAFPGVDISSQMIGNFQSSATFFLEIEGGTSINLSPAVMEQLSTNDSMFDKLKSMIGSLFTAGGEQSLMPSGNSGSVTNRTVSVDVNETRYVEVQRDENGRATSLASLRLQTEQMVADQMQKLFQSIGGGWGGSNGFVGGSASGLWALLGGGNGMEAAQAQGWGWNQSEGFAGFVSGGASWEFEGQLFTNTSDAQQILQENKQLVGRMDIIIDMWEQSGTTANLFSYMQVMGLSDPLVFDLDGDGVNLTSADSGVYFDIKGDGSKPKTAWISGGDAFLYLDETGNGVADDANELFGDHGGHANGFDKLAQYDDNGDGVIDAQDSVYDKLRLWRDLNGDGVNQLSESLTMAEAGIKSVDLGYDKRYEMDQHGNVLGERSFFTRMDGSQGQVIDAWLKQKK